MTKTDPRLELVERQRRFEWGLASVAQTRAAGAMVAGKTHDLLNFIQIVQLTVQELARRHALEGSELLVDLVSASTTAHHQLAAMMAIARPTEVIVAGAPVGAVITAAIDAIRTAGIAVALDVTARPELTTRCSADELAHVLYGLARAAPATARTVAIDLVIRERTIERAPWLELLCGTPAAIDDEPFDLCAVDVVAGLRGGELSRSERRGGGSELIVALPLVSPAPG